MSGNALPETGYIRLPAVLRVIPVSRYTWWAWVKSGKAPKNVKPTMPRRGDSLPALFSQRMDSAKTEKI